MLARDGSRYAVYVEDASADPIILALATPDGTCGVIIHRDQYDPFAVLAMVEGWEREDIEPDPLWWRASIQEPDGRTVEIDAARGMSLTDWESYASCYHGPGCAVTPLLPLPKAQASINLDKGLAAACEGVAGITKAQLQELLSSEDIKDIEAGDIPVPTLRGYSQFFAERTP